MVRNGLFPFFFLLLLLSPHLSAENNAEHGIDLCSDFSRFLTDEGCSPEYQQLVTPGLNTFPSNITVTFPVDSSRSDTVGIDNPELRQTLILAFTMEDADQHRDTIRYIIKTARSSAAKYNLVLLFSYGDNDSPGSSAYDMPDRGTMSFIKTVNSPDDCAAICITFKQQQNPSVKKSTKPLSSGRQNMYARIVPGGGGDISPKWLVKRLSDTLTDSAVPYFIEGGTNCSLYRLGILQSDARTSEFLANDIPCAGLLFYSACTDDQIGKSLSVFLSSYTVKGTDEWERHYIPCKFGQRTLFAGESLIVFVFIITAFFSLFILSELSFIINRKKSQTFQDIAHQWYDIVITFALSVLSFELSQPAVMLMVHIFHADIFAQFAVKLSASFILAALFSAVSTYRKQSSSDRGYAYLLTIICVFNIFLFSTIDISLFFVFTIQLFIVYLSRAAKKPVPLIIMFFLMALPFISFFSLIMQYSDLITLTMLVTAKITDNMILACAFLPFQLQWLRILASMNGTWLVHETDQAVIKRRSFISFACASLFVCASIITATSIFSKQTASSGTRKNISIQEKSDKVPVVQCTEHSFLGQTACTVSVDLGEQAAFCSVSVAGGDINPVVFSENEYRSDKSAGIDHFLIPSWPPRTMTFRYVTEDRNAFSITVRALYPADGIFIERTATITQKNPEPDGSR